MGSGHSSPNDVVAQEDLAGAAVANSLKYFMGSSSGCGADSGEDNAAITTGAGSRFGPVVGAFKVALFVRCSAARSRRSRERHLNRPSLEIKSLWAMDCPTGTSMSI